MQMIKIYILSSVALFSGCTARVAQQNDTIKKNIIANHANNVHIGKREENAQQRTTPDTRALNLAEPQPTNILDITSTEQFNQILHAQKPTVIKFYMTGCSWCVKMNAVFKSVSDEFAAQGVDFYQINGPQLQANIHLAQQTNNAYKIGGYPYFLFIKDGQPVNKILGGTTLENLQKMTASLLS